MPQIIDTQQIKKILNTTEMHFTISNLKSQLFFKVPLLLFLYILLISILLIINKLHAYKKKIPDVDSTFFWTEIWDNWDLGLFHSE